MASVTSLDQDMRKLRLSRYTAATSNEARVWIEDVLGRALPPGDLLEGLKDGVALCELANLVLPAPGIKFKKSAMPFVQMENISHFLRACEMPPLNLPAHDRFLTVDLYESKDPAQVLQCLGAFSRQAHNAAPSRFPNTIGPKKTGVVSPTTTGTGQPTTTRAMSPAITGGSQTATTRSPATVSSWSTKTDQGNTAPAWNPVQYGFMGGADQAKQGVSFGARRQITSASPQVPSLAEKERRRKEREAEQQAEALRRKAEDDEVERQIQAAEQRRWDEETQRTREEERLKIEAQKQEWEEQERRWKEEEDRRRQEEEKSSLQAINRPPEKPRTPSGNILRCQTLSQYQQEQAQQASAAAETPEQRRVKELEKQLEEARARERQYQAEREERSRSEKSRTTPASVDRPRTADSNDASEMSWIADDRETLRHNGLRSQQEPAIPEETEQVPQPAAVVNEPVIEEPRAAAQPPQPVQETARISTSGTIRSPFARPANRTDNFLSSSPAPVLSAPRVSSTTETGDTANEQQALRDQRIASQQKTQAGAWASKSLLEREMERERERQKEWESSQAALKNVPRDNTQGSGPGQSWDVNSYGYIAGDSQNRGSSSGSGIAMGGRRQIIGPRPQP